MNKFFTILLIALPVIVHAQTRQTTGAQTNNLILQTINRGVGQTYKCQVKDGRATTNIFLTGLTAAHHKNYQRLTTLEAEVKKRAAAIEAEEKYLRAEYARTASIAPSDSPAGQYIRQLNIRSDQLVNQIDELEKKRIELAEASETWADLSQIRAIFTGQTYAGLSVWRLVAAPD